MELIIKDYGEEAVNTKEDTKELPSDDVTIANLRCELLPYEVGSHYPKLIDQKMELIQQYIYNESKL